MKKTLLFFVFVLSMLFSQEGSAQCANNLKTAQANFNEGHLYAIPSLLEQCLQNGFSKQDKIEAYQLLTLTYLYIDDPISAERSFLDLLALDPEHRVDSTHYIELLHLSKEYITTPIISWRARGGVNFTNVSVVELSGSHNLNDNKEVYRAGAGFSFIGSLDIHFSRNISFSIESEFSYNTFKYENTVFNKNGVSNAKDLITLKEKSYNVGLPLILSYTLYTNKFYPYIYAGYSPNYNMLTNTNALSINRSGEGLLITEDNNINLTSIRNQFIHSAVLGVGLKRRYNYNYFFIDVRYKIGLSKRLNKDTQNNFESEPSINTYTFDYQQQDNDFRQNELSITLGYVWPKYKPRKRKSVTAKLFIGGIFNKKEDE